MHASMAMDDGEAETSSLCVGRELEVLSRRWQACLTPPRILPGEPFGSENAVSGPTTVDKGRLRTNSILITTRSKVNQVKPRIN